MRLIVLFAILTPDLGVFCAPVTGRDVRRERGELGSAGGYNPTTSFKCSSPSSKYVKLNVGGALYYTTMQTLTKQDTMLKAMFSGRMEVLTDSEGIDDDMG